jgi:hypothetical protein
MMLWPAVGAKMVVMLETVSDGGPQTLVCRCNGYAGCRARALSTALAKEGPAAGTGEVAAQASRVFKGKNWGNFDGEIY